HIIYPCEFLDLLRTLLKFRATTHLITLSLHDALPISLHLVLRGVAAHLEDDLAVAVRRRRRLLGNVRTDDDLRQPLLVTQRAHAVRPSRILAAGTVMTTRSAATRLRSEEHTSELQSRENL